MPRNLRLLIIHLIAAAAAIAAVALFFALGFKSPECYVVKYSGRPCIACGSTRSVLSLLRLQPVRAFLYNPMPVIAVGLWLFTTLREATCLALGIDRPLGRKAIAIYAAVTLSVGAIYHILRLCGAVILPDQLGALL